MGRNERERKLGNHWSWNGSLGSRESFNKKKAPTGIKFRCQWRYFFFHLCEIWGFHSRVADSCTLLWYDTTQVDNRISKFPANTMPFSSRRVEIPNMRYFLSFRLLKTRKGRFFETSRSNYPKIKHYIPEERNPSILLLLQMGTWIPLSTYKTCSLHS